MDFELHFNFRGKQYSCFSLIKVTEHPAIIISYPQAEELVNEFGEEITVRTDFEKLLHHDNEHPHLKSLQQIILDSAKSTPEFSRARSLYDLLNNRWKF